MGTEKDLNGQNGHSLSLVARECVKITGVREVESFDEGSVVLLTECGELTLEGEGLHVSTLDTARGVVSVDGRIGAVFYGDTAPQKRGLRGRFFG